MLEIQCNVEYVISLQSKQNLYDRNVEMYLQEG